MKKPRIPMLRVFFTPVLVMLIGLYCSEIIARFLSFPTLVSVSYYSVLKRGPY